jgi:hypothetical protein
MRCVLPIHNSTARRLFKFLLGTFVLSELPPEGNNWNVVLMPKEERSRESSRAPHSEKCQARGRAIVPEPHVLSPFLKIAQPGGASLSGYQNGPEPTPGRKYASSQLDTKTSGLS